MACLCGPRIKGSLTAYTSELKEWRMEVFTEVHRALGAQHLCGELGMPGHKTEEAKGGLLDLQDGTSLELYGDLDSCSLRQTDSRGRPSRENGAGVCC